MHGRNFPTSAASRLGGGFSILKPWAALADQGALEHRASVRPKLLGLPCAISLTLRFRRRFPAVGNHRRFRVPGRRPHPRARAASRSRKVCPAVIAEARTAPEINASSMFTGRYTSTPQGPQLRPSIATRRSSSVPLICLTLFKHLLQNLSRLAYVKTSTCRPHLFR